MWVWVMTSVGRSTCFDSLFDRLGDRLSIVAVDLVDFPPHGPETTGHVLGEGDVGAAVDGDVVVVVEIEELAQTEVTGDRRCFGGDPFHEVAVGDESIGAVVDQVFAKASPEMLLGDGHPHSHAKPLAERSGRDLDAELGMALRMPRSDALELPKVL